MDQVKRSYSFLVIAIVTLAAFLGGVFIYRATRWGPWAFSDSAAYLSAARNFIAGQGLVILNANGSVTRMTEFAPLYPALLGIIAGMSGDFILAARWIAILAFSLAIFTAGLFTLTSTKNYTAALFVSISLAISPILVDVFSGLMSEALFICLMMGYLFFLWAYLSHPEPKTFLLLMLFSSLLPITRYAGIVFPIGAGLLITVFGKKDIRRNLARGFGLSLTTLLPIGIWFLDLYLQLDKVGGKRFTLDFSFIQSLINGTLQEFEILRGWYPYYGVYPGNFINTTIVIFFSSLIALCSAFGIQQIWKYRSTLKPAHYLFLASFTLAVLYLLFITVMYAVTTPQIDIINRMLAPTIPILILMVASVYSLLPANRGGHFGRALFVITLLIAARYNLLVTETKVEEYNQEGFGFNSRAVQQSGFLQALITLDKDQPMISNSAAFVLFHINRFPLNANQFHNRSYGSGDAYGERTFREKNAPLIIYIPDFYNFYGSNAPTLLATLTENLEVFFSDPVGAIYYYQDSATQP